MTKRIKATGDGACLFNAMAIGLAVEILSGRLDAQKDNPGYQNLLNEFAQHHPNFKPKSWKTLKEWLAYYNHPRDIELILAPVLFKLNRRNQKNLDNDILNELTNLVWRNKDLIEFGFPWFQLATKGESGESLYPKLDNLEIKNRNNLLQALQQILPNFNPEDDSRDRVKVFLQTSAKSILADLKEKIIKDPNAFQRAYSCAELKGVTDALSLNLQENNVDSAPNKETTIRLVNANEHWDVECDDNEIKLLGSASPNKLKFSSFEAFQGQIVVTAPTVSAPKKEEVKQDDNQLDPIVLLKQSVQKATEDYIQYSKSIRISIFHHHGNKGRSRANEFNQKFQKLQGNYVEMKAELLTYLLDEKNGNTHPHSYRTMLLHQLLPEDARGSLADTSQYFPQALEFYNKPFTGTVNAQI